MECEWLAKVIYRRSSDTTSIGTDNVQIYVVQQRQMCQKYVQQIRNYGHHNQGDLPRDINIW